MKDSLIQEAVWQLADVFFSTMLERSGQKLKIANSEPRGLYDRDAAARYLSIGTTKLDELRKTKLIKSVDMDGRPMFTKRELDRFIKTLK